MVRVNFTLSLVHALSLAGLYDPSLHRDMNRYGCSRTVTEEAAKKNECASVKPLVLTPGQKHDVVYTYDVTFVPSDTVWATRWDTYLAQNDPKIHYFK
jgi:hypothetical protein